MDKKEAKRILSDAKAVLTQYIESRGLRKTQERYAILEAVYGFNEPFSIEDLSNALMEKCQVTLPTLYRTLDLFITLGLVIRHTLKRVWFSNGIHHHYGCEKFVPGFSEEFFRKAAKSVGADQYLKDI